MKGIIFNVLESFVDENFGDGTFDTLVELALPEREEPFVGPETYDDEELLKIVGKALEVKKLELEPVLKSFGEYLFFKLAEKYSVFVTPHKHPKNFIKTIHDVIHVEVKKIHPGSVTPDIECFDETEKGMKLKYTSARKMFALAEGLLIGAGKFYNTPMKVDYVEKNPEQNSCTFQLQF